MLPIVAIGASAGGLEAISEFLEALPPKSAMAYVVIQHLDPAHRSLLAEILAKKTTMPVEQIHDGLAGFLWRTPVSAFRRDWGWDCRPRMERRCKTAVRMNED